MGAGINVFCKAADDDGDGAVLDTALNALVRSAPDDATAGAHSASVVGRAQHRFALGHR